MIVVPSYQGDDDKEIAWKQHDVYYQALGKITATCNRLTRFAKKLLGDKSHDAWGSVSSYDHRTLQGAHDLLAAAWRFRHDLRQGELLLEKKPEPLVPHTPENLWLWWLQDEVDSWVWETQLVRNVQLILANQNQPIGYLAESKLCLALMDRFPDVPWRPKLRDAYEKDLANDLAKLAEASQAPKPKTKAIMDMPCECKGHPPCNMIPCMTTAARAIHEG